LPPDEFPALLSQNPVFVVLDVEATGGNFPPERMMELGMVRIESDGSQRSWESLLNPEREIPPFVADLTGIRPNMVRQAPLFADLASEIDEFSQGAWLVGHPVSFDYRYLCYEMGLAGRTYERPLLCTQALARHFLPDQPSYSLGKLCRGLGIPTSGRHRALGDALLTTALFRRVMEAAQLPKVWAFLFCCLLFSCSEPQRPTKAPSDSVREARWPGFVQKAPEGSYRLKDSRDNRPLLDLKFVMDSTGVLSAFVSSFPSGSPYQSSSLCDFCSEGTEGHGLKLLGQRLLRDLRPGRRGWVGGQFLDPVRGYTYLADVEPVGERDVAVVLRIGSQRRSYWLIQQ
jgi:DNA polymerase III epsilon subunit-like protein